MITEVALGLLYMKSKIQKILDKFVTAQQQAGLSKESALASEKRGKRPTLLKEKDHANCFKFEISIKGILI
jgi:hypothetical protein